MIGVPEFDIDPKLLFLIPHIAAFPDVGECVLIGDHDGDCIVHDWSWELLELDHFIQSIAAVLEIVDDFAHDVLKLVGHFAYVGLIEGW